MRVKRRIHLSESHPRNWTEATIHCSLNEALFATSPGYKLTINKHKIKLIASDFQGLRHAIVTLIQIFGLYYPVTSNQDLISNEIPNSKVEASSEETEHGITSVAITDWPDFAMRAVLLDLNPYGRVPKIETLLGKRRIF